MSYRDLDWGRCLTDPFPITEHQKDGVRALVADDDAESGRVVPRSFALFDDPGTSKTRQVVDSACFLVCDVRIDTVLVVCPAAVRGVWAGAQGEVAKWSWLPWRATEFYSGGKNALPPPVPGQVEWVVTNFDFIRTDARRKELEAQLKGRKVWIVVDESSRIKSHKSATTKSCKKLRERCCRATILNGTPTPQGPLDLVPQLDFLDRRILGLGSFYQARSLYAKMGGFKNKQIVAYQNIDDLNRRIAPYILRRRLEDCTQLPDRAYQQREFALTEKNWKVYRDMRDGMVAWLDGQPARAAVARQAVVKILRLAQITSGLLGGVEETANPEDLLFADQSFEDAMAALGLEAEQAAAPARPRYQPPEVIGGEKLDAFLDWFDEWREGSPNDSLVVWSRFRMELDRVIEALRGARGAHVVEIRGGQSKTQREDAIRDFSKERGARTTVMCGSPQAGGLGLTLIEANVSVYLSNDFNLLTRDQSEKRVYRRGQSRRVRYVDFLATGPQGQKTMDHRTLRALLAKEDMARLTTADWRRVLTEE